MLVIRVIYTTTVALFWIWQTLDLRFTCTNMAAKAKSSEQKPLLILTVEITKERADKPDAFWEHVQWTDEVKKELILFDECLVNKGFRI